MNCRFLGFGPTKKSKFHYDSILDWNSPPISVKSLQNRESLR